MNTTKGKPHLVSSNSGIECPIVNNSNDVWQFLFLKIALEAKKKKKLQTKENASVRIEMPVVI